MISKANFELLLREGRSFEDYFRFEQEEPDMPPLPQDVLDGIPEEDFEESPVDEIETEDTIVNDDGVETAPPEEATDDIQEEGIPEEGVGALPPEISETIETSETTETIEDYVQDTMGR